MFLKAVLMLARRSYLNLVVTRPDEGLSSSGRETPIGEGLTGEDGADDLAACLQAVGERQDRDAFRVLFEHFAPRIKSYGVKLGCTSQQADELVQETLVKVWRKAGLYHAEKSAPSTWIFRIARNQRIDSFRRENHPDFDPNDPCFIPDGDTPADIMIEQQQSHDRLRATLETLPEEQKLLLQMSFYEDMSHSLIAEKLSLPLGTVKSRLRLAMGKLRSRLDEYRDFVAQEPSE
mgnify:CR=1 FL=1|tara:strand:+ start:316569 stop:317270 length:702 start_codon:yes stop_codon:yes gene_type:complete